MMNKLWKVPTWGSLVDCREVAVSGIPLQEGRRGSEYLLYFQLFDPALSQGIDQTRETEYIG